MKNGNTSLLNNVRDKLFFPLHLIFAMINHNPCLKQSYSLSSRSVGFRALQRISWIIVSSLYLWGPFSAFPPTPSQASLSHPPHPMASLIHLSSGPTQGSWNGISVLLFYLGQITSLWACFLTYKILVIVQASQGGCLNWKRLAEIT